MLGLKLIHVKLWSNLADPKADLPQPWWAGEVLWSRREVGTEREWVLEGPERSVNLAEVSPTVSDYCFELFKTIGSSREWRAVVDRALESRVRSLEGRQVTVNVVSKGRACSWNEPRRPSQPTTTELRMHNDLSSPQVRSAVVRKLLGRQRTGPQDGKVWPGL